MRSPTQMTRRCRARILTINIFSQTSRTIAFPHRKAVLPNLIFPCLSVRSRLSSIKLREGSDETGIDPTLKQRGHPILFLSREKVRKNKIFENNELKMGPLFRNTPPFESAHGFLLVSTNLSPMTNSESKRYHYPVCHTVVATDHPLSRFQSSARGPELSPTRSFMASTLVLGLLSSKIKNAFIRLYSTFR